MVRGFSMVSEIAVALEVEIPKRQKKINADIVEKKIILIIVLVFLLSNTEGAKSIIKGDPHIKTNAINKIKVPF